MLPHGLEFASLGEVLGDGQRPPTQKKENGAHAACEGVEVSEGMARAYSFWGKKRVCAEMLREITLGDLGSLSD